MQAAFSLLCLALRVYWYVLLARIVLSWFMESPRGWLGSAWGVLYDLTEPFLRPFRRLVPPLRLGGLGLDLSPILAFVLLGVVQQLACWR
jgi:YggT family protein